MMFLTSIAKRIGTALIISAAVGCSTPFTDDAGLKFKEPDAKFFEKVDRDKFPRGDGSPAPAATPRK